MKTNADLRAEHHGSIILLRPLTERARQWLKSECQAEGWQYFGTALAIEPRYAQPIIDGAIGDGLSVNLDTLLA